MTPSDPVDPPGRPRTRLAFAAWGSAGDLLPFLPPVHLMAGGSSDLATVVPRVQAAYLRSLGCSCTSLGDGGEVVVVGDETVLTRDEGGWASWRRMWDGYVAPFVAHSADHRGAATAWGSDALVATDFAVHGRLAAARAGIPCVTLSIYPQLRRDPDRVLLATDLAAAVRHRLDDSAAVGSVLAGDPRRTVLLHDPVLVGDDFASPPLGFPDFDGFPPSAHEAPLGGWLDAGGGTTVAISMGSFLGRAAGDRWSACVEASLSTAERCILVGAPAAVVARYGDDIRVAAAPWVRHRWLLPRVDAVIHHGGIGTTFAALRATCPAVVMPIAFDQAFNARLVERVGAGVDATDTDVGEALRWALRPEARAELGALAGRLVTPAVAAAAVATRCTELLGWPT